MTDQTIQTPLLTFLKNHFTPNDVEHYLPLKNGNATLPFFGTKTSFTSRDFHNLKENDVVIRDCKKFYTKRIDYDKADAFELNIHSIDENICVIDVDGDNEKLLDFKTMEPTQKNEWVNNTIPEIFKSCPYTLSRKKNLPHYYFILTGIEKKEIKKKSNIIDSLSFCVGDFMLSHIWEISDRVVFNYNGFLPTIHIDMIKPFLLEKALKNIIGKPIKPKPVKPVKPVKPIKLVIEKTEDEIEYDNIFGDCNDDNDDEQKVFNEKDFQLVKAFIDEGLLKNTCCNGHHDWINAAYALKNTFGDEKGFELFELLTLKHGTENKKNEYANVWKYVKNDDKTSNNKLTIGSIKRWAKLADPEKYKEIIKGKPLDEGLYNNLLNKYGLVQYFTSDIGMVNLIKKLQPDKFIWINSVLYCWTGFKWEKNNFEFQKYISIGMNEYLNEVSSNIKTDFTCDDVNIKDKTFMEELACITDILYIISFCKRVILTSLSTIKRIIEASEPYFNNDKIKFDDNPDLLGFNNGVYDLIKHEFRPYKYDDYMTMTCGYDYTDKIDPIKLKELNNLIEKIMPDPDVRKLYLQILSAGLTGKAIEKFVIFNGGGRNGKGLMNEFMKLVLGDYALIYANVSILTEKDKTGPNPEKAMLNNKRFVVMKEPESGIKLKNDRVKDITGGGNISGRMCFSNETEIKLSLMLVMECNERPLFEKTPTDAEYERLLDIEHTRRFSSLEEDIDNINVFKADVKYKTNEWKDEHKNEMLYILIQSFKQLQNNDYNFNVPACVKERTNDYLSKSFPILEIFKEFFEPTEEPVEPIKLKDICNIIQGSDAYLNLDKKDKRTFNHKYIYEFIEKNRTFRGKYFDRKKINNKDYKNVLIGFKKIVIENDNENINNQLY